MARSRILVVDDEPGMLRVVDRVLGSKYDVVCAASPSEALVLVEEFQPDLAILDVRMPEMNGFQLMELLCHAEPDLDVIIMTGSVGALATRPASDPPRKKSRTGSLPKLHGDTMGRGSWRITVRALGFSHDMLHTA